MQVLQRFYVTDVDIDYEHEPYRLVYIDKQNNKRITHILKINIEELDKRAIIPEIVMFIKYTMISNLQREA